MGYFEKEMRDILEILKEDLKTAIDEKEKEMIEEKILAQEAMLEILWKFGKQH